QQLLEFDEPVDERERHLRPEYRVLAATDARVDFEDRVSGLLERKWDDLADLRNILGRLTAYDRDAAETDVVQLMQRRIHSNARREMRKQFASFITRCAEPDLPASRTPQLFVREHATPLLDPSLETHRARQTRCCPRAPRP